MVWLEGEGVGMGRCVCVCRGWGLVPVVAGFNQ